MIHGFAIKWDNGTDRLCFRCINDPEMTEPYTKLELFDAQPIREEFECDLCYEKALPMSDEEIQNSRLATQVKVITDPKPKPVLLKELPVGSWFKTHGPFFHVKVNNEGLCLVIESKRVATFCLDTVVEPVEKVEIKCM